MSGHDSDDGMAHHATRRAFLKTASLGVAAGLTPVVAHAQTDAGARASSGPVPSQSTVVPAGDRYKALVPDTLDLARRAELALNALTHNMEVENFYSVYQAFDLTKPVLPASRASLLLWNGTAMNARSLPLVRTMCGSAEFADIEYRMMRLLTDAIDTQGHVRYVAEPGARGSTANPIVDALVLLSMDNWHQRDGNPAWKNRIRLVGTGLQRIAVQVEDRAFYPLECGYDADGTWRVLRKGQLLPYTAPAEPQFDQQGAEGAVKIQSVRQMAALLRQYQLTGDAGALDVARRLARFVLKPSLWIDASAAGIAGNEHGMFEGHFHGSTFTLQMLATLAALDEDPALFRLVRAGYHHAQRFGVMPMGWFPAWTARPRRRVGQRPPAASAQQPQRGLCRCRHGDPRREAERCRPRRLLGPRRKGKVAEDASMSSTTASA